MWLGLSPRVRGNRAPAVGRRSLPGSIPACTGEPFRIRSIKSGVKVYPRVYGGTAALRRTVAEMSGLSPRVRGNLEQPDGKSNMARSIPACTGEP